MKLKDLIKDGWPEKNDETDFPTLEEDSPELNKMLGWNACLAVIEPIKKMEVELNREVIGDLITDLQLGLSMEEKWKIANHLAANLDKIFVVGKGKNA